MKIIDIIPEEILYLKYGKVTINQVFICIVYDDLHTKLTVSVKLANDLDQQIFEEGFIDISNEDYSNLGINGNVNDDIVDFVLKYLSLTKK